MPAPAAPQIIVPNFTRLVYGVESATAGTAATTGLTQEACTSIVTAIQRTPIEEKSYTGNAQSLVDITDGPKHAQITAQLPVRAGGFVMQALACILGNGCDVVTGAVAPYTHTMKPNGATPRCNTMTIWHDTGDRTSGNIVQNVAQMTWATVQSIKFTINPTALPTAEIVLLAQTPTFMGGPTPTNFIGVTAGYGKAKATGFNNSFTFENSAGSPYIMPGTSSTTTNTVLSLDCMLQRQLEPVVTAFNQTPQDFIPGELEFTGNADLRYDGAGAASVYRDYLDLKELGSSTNPHKILMTIDPVSSYTLELDFWPIRFTSFQAQPQGQQVHAQIGWQGYSDLATLNAAVPGAGSTNAASIIKQVLLINALATALVT